MRNLRKTRKRGGFNYIENFYECGTKITARGTIKKVTKIQCYKNFAKEYNFTIVETADDGNCFYDTLSKYGARTNISKLKKSHMELRKEIIGSLIDPEKLEKYSPFFVENKIISPENEAIEVNVVNELTKFLKPYQWAGWMGDIIPQIAAELLQINIEVYDVLDTNNNNDDTPNSISKIIFAGGGNGLPTVSMLRTNGNHFRLLWPKDIKIVSKRKPTAANLPNSTLSRSLSQQENNNIKKAIYQSLLSAQINNKKSASKKNKSKLLSNNFFNSLAAANFE